MPKGRELVKWVVAILAGAYLAYVAARSIALDPGNTGFILGTMTAPFLIALAIRWLYLRLRPSGRSGPLATLWAILDQVVDDLVDEPHPHGLGQFLVELQDFGDTARNLRDL